MIFFFQASKYNRNLQRLKPILDKYLQEGVLKEEFVLDSIPKLMNHLREANVTLRWLMLHTTALTPGKVLYSFIDNSMQPSDNMCTKV